MVDINRAQRIGDQIRKELGRLFLQEVKDKRIQLTSITDVKVSRDLGYAKVFYQIVDDDQDKADIATALKKAGGFLRTRLAKELELRTTPRLTFIYDDSMEYGRHISDLINKVVVTDDSKPED